MDIPVFRGGGGWKNEEREMVSRWDLVIEKLTEEKINVNVVVHSASDCQCQSRNSPGFDHIILRIWGAADEAVLNNVYKKRKIQMSSLYNGQELE